MGRRRGKAYWNKAGGGSGARPTHAVAKPVQLQREPETQTPAAEEQPVVSTRRSLRQQARQAAKVSFAEDDFVDIDDIEDEDEEEYVAPTQPRKKRFLKDPSSASKGQVPQKKPEAIVEDTPAAVLSRLIGNSKREYQQQRGHSAKPAHQEKSKVRYVPHYSSKNGRAENFINSLQHIVPKPFPLQVPSPMQQLYQVEETHMQHLPLKVEVQEQVGTVSLDGPKRRGRKRKSDMPMNLSMRRARQGLLGAPLNLLRVEPAPEQSRQDPEWNPQSSGETQKKRGRQSAATANVKNRFPFCTLCLSKNSPSDYVINHMSCPPEYQRMKRLFSYIYKDLKFPFMPFDLERENVFDYCDLPLCDNCLQLYREIYDAYSQIETARDQLKSKIERMVYQIQLSEQNSAVSQQLSSIKNSPDALMNKYCNFRRRFATYKPGEHRGDDQQSAAVVPGSIARIRVMNCAPRRTTGVQTFLTQGDFPTKGIPVFTEPVRPPPPTPTAIAESSTASSSSSSIASSPTVVTLSSSTTSTSASDKNPVPSSKGTSSTSNNTTPVVVKQEIIEKQKSTSAPKSSVSVAPGNVSKNPTTSAQPNAKPVLKTVVPSKTVPTKPSNQPTSKPSTNPAPVKPQVSANIVKPVTPVKTGPKPNIIGHTAKLLAIATPTHKSAALGKVVPNGAAGTQSGGSASSKPLAAVKSEPSETRIPATEDTDPFLSGDSSSGDAGNSDSGRGSTEEGNKSKGESNVFHKHKKLRIIPVQFYSDLPKKTSDKPALVETDKSGSEGSEKTNEVEEKKTETGKAEGKESTIVEDVSKEKTVSNVVTKDIGQEKSDTVKEKLSGSSDKNASTEDAVQDNPDKDKLPPSSGKDDLSKDVVIDKEKSEKNKIPQSTTKTDSSSTKDVVKDKSEKDKIPQSSTKADSISSKEVVKDESEKEKIPQSKTKTDSSITKDAKDLECKEIDKGKRLESESDKTAKTSKDK